ncbi:PTS transporter subunit EIIC [Streptococcus merionis]|uniref:PTS transporter subunit EIIC n=1 Tax=Streptococcus merionis TaxID=400065 RepID=UPI0026EF9CA6|nr:PTS transporter subunit EIIC [Streptococcus merionis]
MANDYKQLAKAILEKVGGKDNVSHLVHCATRLRFNLRDEDKADTEGLKNMDGVVTVISQGGQYQVVIGGHVKFVYQEIMNMLGLSNKASGEDVPQDDDSQKGPVAKVLDTIAGIFVPIVPPLAGAGMLKTVLTLLVMVGWVSRESSTYQILNLMSDTAFYFMPIIIAHSAGRKFKTNPYLAMLLGAGMLHPTFVALVTAAREAGTGLDFFGAPVALVNYGSSVIPIILCVWAMSYLEPIVDKYMPNVIRIFGTPMLILLIMTPLTFVVIGPLGNYMGQALASGIAFLEEHVSWLVPTLVGAFTPLLVMTEMHYGIIPIGINMLTTKGIDTVAGPGMMVSNIAQGGAALGIALRLKDKNTKALSISTGISAVLGITEPVLYGIHLRFRHSLYAAMIGGGVSGFYLGIMGVGRYAQVPPGLLALPSFIGGDSSANFINACIACIIAFVASFVVSFILGTGEKKAS